LQLATDEKGDDVEEFFKSRTKANIARTVKQSIERVRINAKWGKSIKNEAELGNVLKERSVKHWEETDNFFSAVVMLIGNVTCVLQKYLAKWLIIRVHVQLSEVSRCSFSGTPSEAIVENATAKTFLIWGCLGESLKVILCKK
jgi:hypothetical protein